VPYSGPVFTSSAPGGINSFDFNGAFAKPGTYNVVFRVHDVDSAGIDSYQDATLVVNVFSPQEFAKLDDTDTESVTNPNLPVDANVGGTSQDGSAAHVDASLGSTPGASVFAGSYTTDPTQSLIASNGDDLIMVGNANSLEALPTAFFDLRASGVEAGSTLTITFTVEIDPSQDVSGIKLYYNDGTNWLPVQTDLAHPIMRAVAGTDPATGREIVQIQFAATMDSRPRIFDLHGTVFTIALPAPQAPPVITPVTGPVATLSLLPAAAPLTTTFSSASSGTFVLRVSQGTDLSVSRTETRTRAYAPVIGGGNSTDSANDARDIQAALDINWLLRALAQSGEENHPIHPALGDDQRKRPVAQPATPDVENQSDQSEQNPDESVQGDVVNAIFARPSHETDLLWGTVGLLTPRMGQVDGVREMRLNAGWALLAAGIGIGRITLPKERRRHLAPW
jgi:hypothetical protein